MKNVLSLAFLSCLIFALVSMALTSPPAVASPRDGIFSHRVGDFEVTMLSERQGEGNPEILIGVSETDLSRFVPTGKFPNAVCVFLIRSPAGTVLVDTGFGKEAFRSMQALDVSLADVDVVLLTHSHGDHIGGLLNDGKTAFPKASVLYAKAEYDWSEPLRKALIPYGKRASGFEPLPVEAGGTVVYPGIRALAAYGHTPGHTMFLLESKGERLLIWGDLTHAMAVQMPRPDVSVTYDSDPVMAAETRKRVLAYAAGDKVPVAGMHVAYPGIGVVLEDPEQPGGYRFVPAGSK